MRIQPPPTFVLNGSDEKVLKAVGRYFYLTAEQLTRLLFSPNSHTYTSEILTKLTRARYLERTVMPRETEFGRAKSVWSLMGKGRSHLEGLGIALLPRVSHKAVRSHSHFRHLLAVNDALIMCEVFARDEDGVELTGFVHERTFHRTPERVELVFSGKTFTTPLAADGWVYLEGCNGDAAFWAEIDRNTEHVAMWVHKIAAIVEYFEKGDYAERFGTERMTVMVVAVPDAGADPVHRRDELRRWTEQTLEKLGHARGDWPDVFRFSAVNPGAIAPRDFFYGRHWRAPFSDEPKALLEGAG